MSSGKFGPFNRKRDWTGKRVELLCDIQLVSGQRIPKHAQCVVIKAHHFGYDLETEKCPTCGISHHMRLRSCADFTLVEPLAE